MRKLLATVLAGVMALSSLTLTAGAADSYNAYIGLQSDGTWAFRNSWDDATYGLGTEYFDSMYSIDWGGVLGGTFTDAVITGDGEYSVKMEGYDFTSGETDVTQMNLIFISTDIPVDAGITISDIKLYIDGNYIATVDYLGEDNADYMHANIVNTWNDSAPVAAATCAIPESSVEIKFTISGMGSEETGAVAPIAVVSIVALVSAGVIVASKKRA